MRAVVVHESRGRLRLRLDQKRMTLEQADLLEAYLQACPEVRQAAVMAPGSQDFSRAWGWRSWTGETFSSC